MIVAKTKKSRLDFEIDKLTNSIENTISGDSFQTEVSLLTKQDLKLVTKKNGWQFNWRNEFKQLDRSVYKLTIEGNRSVTQGLVSFTVFKNYVEIHLIENAPFNKGQNKLYQGVAGNMVAFVCKVAFERGCSGYVSFIAKTRLIEHYKQSLGAENPHGHLIVINTNASRKLIEQYYKS